MRISSAEESFVEYLGYHHIEGWKREHRFHPKRRWRFDFAWIDKKIAAEIEGLVSGGQGRHQTLPGFIGDCEKYEAALELGWTVYRIPSIWIVSGKRRIWRPKIAEILKSLLK